MNQQVNVLALVKGSERYVFLYNGKNRDSILRSLGRYASDPELSFDWRDAAVLSQKIRKEKQRAELRAFREARAAREEAAAPATTNAED